MATNLISISANTSWYLYNFRANLIRTLQQHGYEVLTLAPEDEYSNKLEALGCRFRHIAIDQGGTNPVKDFATLLAFHKVYKQERPCAALHFTPKNNIYGTLAATRLGIPCINNIAGLGAVFIKEGPTARLVRWLYKISQRDAAKIFFQNEEDRALFLDAGLVDQSRTDRLPGSGVDLTRFTPTPAPDDGVVRFILIGRMLFDKGVREYMEAARIIKQQHPNTEFRLLGFVDMNNPSAISKKEIMEWHDAGYINYLGVSERIEEEIGGVDCVVLPSYYREGVPKSLLEAAAMGKPLITTNNTGCRETVDDGENGFICEPRSVDALVSAMERMVGVGQEGRVMMGKKSRGKVEQEFDEAVVLNNYLETIAILRSTPCFKFEAR